ncbi:MAG: DUF4124 domain-containing protein [Candidatus Thiodiazotropha sp.]
MERYKYIGLLLGFFTLLPALPTQAGMYKWYDAEGKLNYTQTPPPPGTQRATINTDTFSSVDMYKAPAITLTNKPKKRSSAKPVPIKKKRTTRTKRTTRSTCPLRR